MSTNMIYGQDEEERKRRERARALRRREEKKARRQIMLMVFLILGIALMIGLTIYRIKTKSEDKQLALNSQNTEDNIASSSYIYVPEPEEEENLTETLDELGSDSKEDIAGNVAVGDVSFMPGYVFTTSEGTESIVTDQVISNYGILVDATCNEIVAAKNADTIINPASMTKILTVLVAAEQIENLQEKLDDTFTITLEITDFAYVNDCSAVGFLDQEVVTVRDLFYGTILPSGGDAAVALATYVAGSQEAFVELMNQKLEELELSDTAHFTNCVGLYDENHVCSVTDMAVILKAAVENDWCRDVLSTHVYTTSATEQHPEGITISNWFLRRIEDKDCGGLVLCGKTGYVVQSGSCAASYFISNEGKPYICVTADSDSSWRCIYDQVEIYNRYVTH